MNFIVQSNDLKNVFINPSLHRKHDFCIEMVGEEKAKCKCVTKSLPYFVFKEMPI